MIRITATLSKKAPMAGIAYSSVEVGAQLEVTATDRTKAEALGERLRELYALLEARVDEQVARASAAVRPAPSSDVSLPAASASGSPPAGGNGRCAPSTQAQRRAIVSICRSQGIDLHGLLKDLEIAHLDDLSVRQASMLIDDLKSRARPAAS